MVQRTVSLRVRALGLSFFVIVGTVVFASRSERVSAHNPRLLTGLQATSCPTTDFCAAVGASGTAVLFDGLWWLGEPAVTGLNPPAQNASAVLEESVSCAAVGSCVAVGNYTDTSGNVQGLIETLEGGTWTATTAPLAGLSPAATRTYTELTAVSCLTEGNCIAVGGYGDTSNGDGLIETLSGGVWSATTAPAAGLSPASSAAALLNLSCPLPGSCTAVGYYDDSSGKDGLIETLSGGTWSAATAPLAGLTPPISSAHTLMLGPVSCAAVGFCVALSEYTDTAGNQQGLIETLSGGTWAATTAPTSGLSPPPAANPLVYLNGVSCPGSGSCVAVGSYVSYSCSPTCGETSPGLIETLSGGTWSPIVAPLNGLSPAPWGGSSLGSSALNAVSCPAVGECVAVGSYAIPPYSSPESFDDTQGLIETLSAGTWTAVAAPAAGLSPAPTPNPNNVPDAVSCPVSGSCVAVGSYTAANGTLHPGLIESLAGGTWAATTGSAQPTCNSVPNVPGEASAQQYEMTGSDGVTWQAVDPNNLCLTLAPTKAEAVLLSGNADLWTFFNGYNQDLGITVSEDGSSQQLLAWKESGGSAGTFSPNAAYVQWLYSMSPGHVYVFSLDWKENRGPSGNDIFAGAGPISGEFSPTSLVAQPFPNGPPNFVAVTTQPTLANSDGATWQTVDPTLSTTLTPASASTAIVGVNADLWTSAAGYNQDIGIFVSDDGDAAQLLTWKESGGFAGTYSPNAAFAEASYPMNAGHTYVFTVKWKSNHATNGNGATIWAGAGPSGGSFSPTDLLAETVPAADAAEAAITSQPQLTGSDGTTWQPIDAALNIVSSPSVTTVGLLSANADLWTNAAGYNQDIGLFVSEDGGTDQLIAWKESGGFAGTFSPNAAFVRAAYGLEAGHSYVFTIKWKTNRNAPSATIYAGAGPIGGEFSPTRLTLQNV